MKERKTAVLLFDYFSNFEISVALSILYQSGRKHDVFCLKEEARSEEGLIVKRTKALDDICIEEYDSLLIPGCMDLRDIIDDDQIHYFLKKFNSPKMVIASISSSPLLLLKAGLLENKKYIAGVMKEELIEEGFTMEQMRDMRDITELKNNDGTIETHCIDGNILTAIGMGFIEFGIEFGKMLNLEFNEGWYNVNLRR
ncbi:DJ-1/PfpI family protein [Abyssisolibacter fermentans]|uniref:DJ-1/PfpI family protein n=1 Tax=Abyssisolibacter fermentans TaxID=1766203 RepID=UPI0008378AF4|nr:DJ-1/PfpI family protein [Abyssisolibacter fermentans]